MCRLIFAAIAALAPSVLFAAEAIVVRVDLKKGTLTVRAKAVKKIVLRKAEAATGGTIAGFNTGAKSARPEVALKLPPDGATYPLKRIVFAPKPADPLEPDIHAGDSIEIESHGKLFVVIIESQVESLRRYELKKLDDDKRERIEAALKWRRTPSKVGKPDAASIVEAEAFEAAIQARLKAEVEEQVKERNGAEAKSLAEPSRQEAAAAATLKIAKQFQVDGKPATARKKLEQIVADYPGTAAAEEAKRLLK